MSASFLAVIGAPLKLWISFSLIWLCLCCLSQQSFFNCFTTVSMRLRPIRTCSGVVCFGCFHIHKFFSLFRRSFIHKITSNF